MKRFFTNGDLGYPLGLALRMSRAHSVLSIPMQSLPYVPHVLEVVPEVRYLGDYAQSHKCMEEIVNIRTEYSDLPTCSCSEENLRKSGCGSSQVSTYLP